MTKKIDDGGLVFPGKRWQQVGTVADHGFSDDDNPTFDYVEHSGMSLRTYIATKAMAALIGLPITDYPGGVLPSFTATAEDAVAYADALIEALAGEA